MLGTVHQGRDDDYDQQAGDLSIDSTERVKLTSNSLGWSCETHKERSMHTRVKPTTGRARV